MAKLSDIIESKFLRKEDVGDGVIGTISEVRQHNVAMGDATPEMKYCVHFAEFKKPLVLNSTNAQLLAMVCGSEDTDDWLDHQVVLYTDHNVSFGGKLVGGIRIRAPRRKAGAAKQAPAVADLDDDGDPTPF